jgi:hypothetical protein
MRHRAVSLKKFPIDGQIGSSLFPVAWANVICDPPTDDHLTVEVQIGLSQPPP